VDIRASKIFLQLFIYNCSYRRIP